MRKRSMIWVTLFIVAVGFTLPAAARTPVQLTLWDWYQPRADVIAEFAAIYMEENPHVEIVVTLPAVWTHEYLENLIVAIIGESPPDIAYFHNDAAEHFVTNRLLTPFPKNLFPDEELQERYFMYPAFLYEGEMYFHPAGIMTPAVFYSRDILEASGFDSVAPSWSDLLRDARQLTQARADGRITQVGFSWVRDFAPLFTDLVYQFGGFLVNETGDGLGYHVGGPEALGILQDLLSAEVSDAPNRPAPGFETGRQAMRYQWTWYAGQLRHVTGFDWQVAALPTPDGNPYPAMGRNNYEPGLSVPRNVPDDRKAEAFQFLAWLYDNENYMLMESLVMGRVPARLDLWSHPEIRRDKVIGAVIEQAPFTVFPGPTPPWLWESIGWLQHQIVEERIAPGVALQSALETGNAAALEAPTTMMVERLYEAP